MKVKIPARMIHPTMSGKVKNKRHRLRPILEPMIAEPKPPNIAPSPNIPPEKKHDF